MEELVMATYDDTEAKEILTRAAANMPEHNPARIRAANELVQSLKGLHGKMGFKFTVADHRNPREGGLVVEMQVGNSMPKRAWVSTDEHGAIWVGTLSRGGILGDMAQIGGLRLSADESQLEGVQEDTFYQPEPRKPRRRRSALAVLGGAT